MAIRLQTRRFLRATYFVFIVIILFKYAFSPSSKDLELDILDAKDTVDQEVPNDTVLTEHTLAKLKELLKCKDVGFEPSYQQRQSYWVLYNFVRADHGPIGCHEGVTFAAHGDFSYMDNLLPVVERWRNPVSFSLHSPGTDFAATVSSIRYARDCTGSDLIKKYVTFHLFFPFYHSPSTIPKMDELLKEPFDCSSPIPYAIDSRKTYKSKSGIVFPINLARNIARKPALTHFHLVTDIELYPSPRLPERFLNMIARNEHPLDRPYPRVFPLSIFEVEQHAKVPRTKSELVAMLKAGTAVPFHKKICSRCHRFPKALEWALLGDAPTMEVFHVAKRTGRFATWEPIFVGTRRDPPYDERLTWDGKRDKMPQGYAMCALDYDFMVLNDAFIVHRPGVKGYVRKGTKTRQTKLMIENSVGPELRLLYGNKKDCKI